MVNYTRRMFVATMPFLLAGCTTGMSFPPSGLALGGGEGEAQPGVGSDYRSIYAGFQDGRFPVPTVDLSLINPRFYRQQVSDPTGQPPGTIVVDPDAHFLYLVGNNGSATRYGVGVGRQGFGWNGTATIKRKSPWPTWTPPADMVARDEKAAAWARGMPGGPGNPLGARALYLFQGNRDTLYRLHGTIEPASIGKSMSSGCIRLLNQDIIDLYNRVSIGTRVVVLPSQGGGQAYAEGSADVEPAPYENRTTEYNPGAEPAYRYDPASDTLDGPQ